MHINISYSQNYILLFPFSYKSDIFYQHSLFIAIFSFQQHCYFNVRLYFATTFFNFFLFPIATGTHAASICAFFYACMYVISRGSIVSFQKRGSNLMRCCRCSAVAVALGALQRAASLQFMSMEKSSLLEHVFSLPPSIFRLSGFLLLFIVFVIARRYDLFYYGFVSYFIFFTPSFCSSLHWSQGLCYKFFSETYCMDAL